MRRFSKTRSFFLNEIRDNIIIIAISLTVTYFFAGSNLFLNFSAYLKPITYGFVIGWTIWKGNQVLGYFLDIKFPWGKNPVKTLIIHVSASIIYTSIDIVVVNYFIYRFIFNEHILSDVKRFLGFASIQFGIALLVTTILYLLQFFKFWRESVLKEEQFKREALSLQYETLKSYVNPHFLFNSLSVLSSLVEKDTKKSQEFIKQLSDIYRYVLEQKDKELVPLKTELDFITVYINLFKIRHGDNLNVDLNITNDVGSVIPLSLQILLENAFKHNIISSEEPLSVSIYRESNYIVVKNKLQTKRTINQTGGIGLDTISKRYEYFTQRAVEVNEDNGNFTVKIPIIDLSVLDGYR